ncbi:calcium-activated chloride channel protein (macronuclear) [Tetrahymena thermophila SB210]|uniref:Calcium-activated chloride channel protein n=1 Tax=Tetrahymena thermophila (strain SB210) TaxID=312017 RepID=Q233Y7_TETTS|nr:calcium-activated chloride channel protein [Tetrahymena thermophila SB210]EAR92115.2 calcium-activated chloride channel protein [Tetrahymena thermophila SB210]|eukprot:XP_001012361.2 calcium-activated chloride channel protein [Tetrahymena thermophila SB210]
MFRQKSPRKSTTYNQERFDDGPQFALVLNSDLSQIQISTISKQFSMYGLKVLQTQSLDRKKNILFIELSNILTVFTEAQELQIRKNYKLSKTQIQANELMLIKAQNQYNIEVNSPESQKSDYYRIDQILNNIQNPMDDSEELNSNQNGGSAGQSQATFQEKKDKVASKQQQYFRFDSASPTQRSLLQKLEKANKETNGYKQNQLQQNQQETFELLTKQSNQEKPSQNGHSNQINGTTKTYNKKISKEEQVKLLEKIDPRIQQYEKLNVIKTEMLYDLDKEGNVIMSKRGLGIFTPAERLRITYSYMNKIRIKDLRFLEFLQEQQLITEIIPLHEKNAAISDSIQSIEDYYGENISSYFEFLDFYQKWLLYPAILGLITYVLSNKFFTKQYLYFYFFYTVFICIWSSLFYIFWKRYESELQVKWGVFGKKIYKEDRNVNFKGQKRIKVTTMCEEEYYPRSKRLYLYIISTLESLPLLVMAFLLKVIIFNLNGLIHKNSMLYIESIASLTEVGGILAKLPLKETIFNVIMIVFILKINEFYNTISSKSTQRENHRTNNDFNSSLVIKRFIFDLINRFTHFFFIAFVVRDINSLKSLLGSLFLLDEVRKVATESVVPWVMKKIISMKKQKETNPEEDDNTIKKNEELNQLYADSIREIEMLFYDDFDDYIEVVAQIAFITLFAAVNPLASFFSYLFNILERSSDKFKLSNRLYRRPMPFKVQGINAWNKVIFLISIFCIFTNVAFLCFDYYKIYDLQIQEEYSQMCYDSDLNSSNNVNNLNVQESQESINIWNQVYITMFSLEHLILLVITFLYYFISQQPKWVRVYKRRMAIQQVEQIQQQQ